MPLLLLLLLLLLAAQQLPQKWVLLQLVPSARVE
jgi:hypothetical protein